MVRSLPGGIARPSRRGFLRGAVATVGAVALPTVQAALPAPAEQRETLRAAVSQHRLVGPAVPATELWTYGGGSPGPLIRARLGQPLMVELENALAEPTTVHWHGIRVPNAMDGVPDLTQAPVAPGERFVYRFSPPHAGTYWYHAHVRSFEQVGRGLYGPLVVEEAEPLAVDRELVLVLDDWRLDGAAVLRGGFGGRHDAAHAGRIGNTVTVNGRIPEGLTVEAGERLRLRLINAANARHFALDFQGHRPLVIAQDGQPVTPHPPDAGLVFLAPAARIDLLLDCTGAPGQVFQVVDRFYRGRDYLFTSLRYGTGRRADGRAGAPVHGLPDNGLPEPDLARATAHEMVLTGGAMGGMRGATLDGRWVDARRLARLGQLWAVNGAVMPQPAAGPALIRAALGESVRVRFRNDTAFVHPMHLHGHHFRVLARNGVAPAQRLWLDTVAVFPNETVEVAFVADNPGRWLLHCHVLEHAAAGMSRVLEVV